MMTRDLMLALLSLDSYNRGYGVNLDGFTETGQLGNVTLLAATSEEQEGWQEAGFYAIAYDMSDVAGFEDGERVISYRGTNFNWFTDSVPAFLSSPALLDAINGWGVGVGLVGSQAELAIEFYNELVGDGNRFNANITTTGHSLGGGLAGLVAIAANDNAFILTEKAS